MLRVSGVKLSGLARASQDVQRGGPVAVSAYDTPLSSTYRDICWYSSSAHR